MINPAHPDYTNTPASPARPSLKFLPVDTAAPPVVSIVTPFFNGGAIFYETVESVFRQTLQQWEWIIVNDGSSEPEALRILAEFRHKDPRIRVVDHAQNQGLSAARNTGFHEARAEFIFQLDADDLIEPTTLEKMAWHLQTHPEFGFATGYTVGFGSKEYLWRNGFHSGKGFLQENLVTATCLVRKSVHQAVGGYESEIRGGLEDWDFWLKAASQGHWGSTIPEFFDWYRRRDTGREHWDNVVQTDKTEKFRARLKQKYPGLWQDKFPRLVVARPQGVSSVTSQLPFTNALTKTKPRLLFLVPHFELGGADKFNLDLIRQLQHERGYEITVVGTRRSGNPWLHEFESLTPDVFALNQFLHISDYPLFLRYLIASRQPDVVCLSNSQLAYQLLPYLRAHFPNVPFVDYLHMEQEEWMRGGYPRTSLEHGTQLSRTVVSSQHLKNWMTTRGGNAQAIEVCHTNIDSEKWNRDRFDGTAVAQKWKVDRTRPVILYAGRICDQKQPRVFAETMRQLARKHPQFTTLVAGDGPDLPWLKEFVERERLRQVRFLGAVPNDAIAELLAISDIFFLPSQWEGISLAVYEAMAMGAVPVTAVVGGQAELVTPDCGVLVKRGANEVTDYTNALAQLIANPAERASKAEVARCRVVEQFPIAKLGQRMDTIFRDAKVVATTSSQKNILPAEIAALHAAGVVEQTRATDHADMLHREREQLMPFVKQSLQWQSCCRAGRALAAVKQNKAAIEQFEEGLRSAIASRMANIELPARIEIGKALIPLDRPAADKALRGALPLIEQAEDASLRPALMEALASLGETRASMKPTTHEPLVSVVIPCYQQAHFLSDAIESVVAQAFTDWEILVVNDGSPDNTSDVAKQLIAKYSDRQIKLIEKANGGLPSARNAGMRAARGKYFLPLDADDKIAPALLAKLVPILDANPKVGFAYPHIRHFGALDTEFPLPDFDRATLISKDNIACVCSLVRKTAWEQAGGYNEAMREGYEDWDFWISCVEKGWEGFCLHEPLFLYRKSGQSMLTNANQKRERLIARIVQNHPSLYDEATRQWSAQILERHAASVAAEATKPVVVSNIRAVSNSVHPEQKRLRITYLIGSILGVTGGNQTLLRQAEEMRRRGHDVTIVTYTAKPEWFKFETRVIQAPAGQPLAKSVPPSDVVVATYFTNAPELRSINAPVKIYYAQGDQFIFGDDTMADTPQNRQFRELSRASYLLPDIRFVPNSHNLASAVQKLCGRKADAILPVCTDQTIFRPLQRSLPGSRVRILIVGPDARGTEAEPLLFKGMQDIHDALQLVAARNPHFTAVRMSGTGPEIFSRFPCEFYVAPSDEMKTVLFGTSHIHIYASHYDSCPRPPQEAMAAGCAVVCTATGGALEYCRDGENALMVPIKSPAAIAAAVERLMQDVALREKLAQGGLATAREFPREREWNEWEAILYRFTAEATNSTGATQIAKTAKPKAVVPIKLPACALAGHLGEARDLLKKKNLRGAWQAGLAALQARPFHPEAFLFLGEVAQAAGDSVSARSCAKHAATIAPEWKPAKQFLKSNLKGNSKPEWLVLPAAVTAEKTAVAPHLTVCMIAKNEEKFLDKCLTSVRGLAMQIIVVDTGSTDRTVEIAKAHGAEVFELAWNDDFSAARNEALKHATGDWVLSLDADEELLPEHRATILEEMQTASVMAFRLPIVDVGREHDGRSYVPRLFRNAPGLFFVGRVHEQIFTSVKVRAEEWGLENRLGESVLLHHGYVPEVMISRDKNARNLRLLRLAIDELPGEPNLVMNLGLELVRSGELEAGLEQYYEALHLMAALPKDQVVPELRESLLTQLTTHLLKAKRHAEIISLWQQPFAQSAGLTASQHFMLGLARLELQQPTEAAEQMRQCVAKRREPALSPINPEILKAGPNHCLALALAALDDTVGAEKAFRAALTDDPQSRPARFDFAKFQYQQGEAVAALQILNDLVQDNPAEIRVWQLGANIAASRVEFLEFAQNWTGEALKYFPDDRELTLQQAEALLLNQQTEAALPLWLKAQPLTSARHLAALVLCEVVAGDCQRQFSTNDEKLVGQEFLKWYRQLIKAGASSLVSQINERMEYLRVVLPGAVNVLETALRKAEAAAVPA